MTNFSYQAPRRVLDAGSGPPSNKRLHSIFAGWSHVRLDIDPAVRPDLVGTITDLRNRVPDASFDAVWSSHNIEHLHSHEVPIALVEMKRLLKPDGFAFITCPDLEQIGRLIAGGDVDRIIYNSAAGPISVIDMLYGHGASIARGSVYMAHNTGFTVQRMGKSLQQAGFSEALVAPGRGLDIWALALMPRTDKKSLMAALAKTDQRFLVPA